MVLKKLVWATFGRPLFVIDRSAKIFIHPQRTDKSVLFFVFAQVVGLSIILDTIIKKFDRRKPFVITLTIK